MKLVLQRSTSTAKSTPGKLFIDGKQECLTLEDVVRPDGVKVYGKTAIPAGTYKVILNMSNRFKRVLPLLVDVPNFEGIRIHPGNTEEDTDGCILVGNTAQTDFIGNSRVTFDALFAKLQQAGMPITITILAAS